MRAWVPVLALLVAGCGSQVGAADPATDARDALECGGEPHAHGAGDYADSGLESVQDTAEAALANYFEQEGFFLQVPTEGYVVEQENDDRVLLSYDVDGRTKVAFVAADGITDWKDAEGWGVESWAACDPSELPAEVAADLGVGVWLDEDGEPVPVTRVESYAGPEHCDWQDITFLSLDSRRGEPRQFLRDTTGELADLLRTSYAARVRLPPDAVDSGFRREGHQLWLAADGTAAYLVVPGESRVERWPAAREPIACA